MDLLKRMKKELNGEVESLTFLNNVNGEVEVFEFINSEELRLEYLCFDQNELKRINKPIEVIEAFENKEPLIYDEDVACALIENYLIKLKWKTSVELKDAVKIDSFDEIFLDIKNNKNKAISIIY